MKSIKIFKHSKLIKTLNKDDLEWMTKQDLDDYYTFCKCTKVIAVDENDEEKVIFNSDKPRSRNKTDKNDSKTSSKQKKNFSKKQTN